MEDHAIMCLVYRIRTHQYGLSLAFGSYDNVFIINTSSLYFSMHHVFFLCSLPLLTLTWKLVRESVLPGVVFRHNLLIAGLVYWKLMRHDIHIESII